MDLNSVFRVRPNSPRGRIIRRRVHRGIGLFCLAVIGWHFPFATDDPVRREDEEKAYYEMAYAEQQQPAEDEGPVERAEERYQIPARVKDFVDRYHLQSAKALDVGSGTGYLQDVVADYTGFDISTTAKRYYHKPFVPGTATAMPFPNDSFDVAWSIWVLEHIPNPEAALSEIRRVVKPGGMLYLFPAYHVPTWAAQGYAVRPYSDFGLDGKLVKASLIVRRNPLWWFVTVIPNRVVRSLAYPFGPTRLHYRRLTPNFEHQWQFDSNAHSHLDSYEIARWFTSRGDECLTCLQWPASYVELPMPLEIRIAQSKR